MYNTPNQPNKYLIWADAACSSCRGAMVSMFLRLLHFLREVCHQASKLRADTKPCGASLYFFSVSFFFPLVWCSKGGVVWWDLRKMDLELRPQLPLIAAGCAIPRPSPECTAERRGEDKHQASAAKTSPAVRVLTCVSMRGWDGSRLLAAVPLWMCFGRAGKSRDERWGNAWPFLCRVKLSYRD